MATKKTTKKTTVNPLKYVGVSSAPKAPTYKNTAKAPAAYKIGTYNSQYADQLSAGLNTLTNWNYDPLKDANYQA